MNECSEMTSGALPDGRRDLADRLGNGGVVGPMVGLKPVLPFLRRDRMVAGDDRAVRDPHDQGRIVLAAVGIDQQAREAAHHRRHAEAGGKPARQVLDADVIGDVAGKGAFRQAQPAVARRQTVRRVIGEEHEATVGIAVDDFEGAVVRMLARHAISRGGHRQLDDMRDRRSQVREADRRRWFGAARMPL